MRSVMPGGSFDGDDFTGFTPADFDKLETYGEDILAMLDACGRSTTDEANDAGKRQAQLRLMKLLLRYWRDVTRGLFHGVDKVQEDPSQSADGEGSTYFTFVAHMFNKLFLQIFGRECVDDRVSDRPLAQRPISTLQPTTRYTAFTDLRQNVSLVCKPSARSPSTTQQLKMHGTPP